MEELYRAGRRATSGFLAPPAQKRAPHMAATWFETREVALLTMRV
jgi:hypothetical protein